VNQVGKSRKPKVGLWLIGAGGRVGSAVALGISALRRGMTTATGLVTELPHFSDAELIDAGSFVIGGHEIRQTSLIDAVNEARRESNLFDEGLIRSCAADLRTWQKNVRPGTLLGASPGALKLVRGGGKRDRTTQAAVSRIRNDLDAFRERKRLDRVVVVNLGSTEAKPRKASWHRSWSSLSRKLTAQCDALPPSSIYGLAAIEAGCAFIDFTPSTGLRLPALQERAESLGALYAGSDGKTGETLVKSALAPMFAMRNLDVMSWIGQNLLGNRDGEVLRDPKTKASKIAGKDAVVPAIVGGRPETHVSIDFVRSLDDWKVAWDYIHFRGFLGTKMAMQFTWQGCDSMLAAPLVIDLARLAALEMQRGATGPMKHLAFFFKDPIGAADHQLSSQFQMLVDHGTGNPA